VWERNLEEYRHSLHHLPESRDPANPLLESAQKGREEIITSLMSMNARYEKLLNEVQIVMEMLVDTLKRQGKEHKEVSLFLFYNLDNRKTKFATNGSRVGLP